MLESGIAANGQTTLPKAVRKALALEPGDRVRYVIQKGDVRIVKVDSIGRLLGVLSYAGPPVSLADMDQAIADGAAEL